MMPAEDYDVAEARAAVHDDWYTDSAGVGYLTRESFCEAIFELADVWTLTTEKSEYASFLSELHSKVLTLTLTLTLTLSLTLTLTLTLTLSLTLTRCGVICCRARLDLAGGAGLGGRHLRVRPVGPAP